MRLALCLVLLIYCTGCRVFAAVPGDSGAMACRSEVIKAMNYAWQQTSNGEKGTEAGFRVDATPNGYEVVQHDFTNELDMLTIELAPATVAEFHVHPDESNPWPSETDRNIADDNDLNIYTFGRQGLYEYRWNSQRTELLRPNTEWSEACK